jgi:hypothetical protein
MTQLEPARPIDVPAIFSHVVMNFDVAAGNFGRTEFGPGRNQAYPMFQGRADRYCVLAGRRKTSL